MNETVNIRDLNDLIASKSSFLSPEAARSLAAARAAGSKGVRQKTGVIAK